MHVEIPQRLESIVEKINKFISSLQDKTTVEVID